MDVERRIAIAPFLVENALVLGAGERTPRTDPGPDATPIANRRRVRRRDGDHRYVAAVERMFVYRHGGQRQDVAVRLAVRQLEQQGVVYFVPHWGTVVAGTNEDHASAAAIRQVVGEGTNGLPDAVRRLAIERFLTLDQIGFDVEEHRGEFGVRVGNRRGRPMRIGKWLCWHVVRCAERADHHNATTRANGLGRWGVRRFGARGLRAGLGSHRDSQVS